MTSKLITAPAAPAVSLADAKANLRIEADDTALDGLVTAYVQGITKFAEHLTGGAFISQTWRTTLPAFPKAIRLARSPLIAIASVKYIDPDGAEQTLPAESYVVDGEYIVPAYGVTWPATRLQANAVTVEASYGFGADETAVPANVRLYIIAKLVEQFDPAVKAEKATVQASFIDRLLDSAMVY
jgi:uncharacterized phiE125 gp8 family phage protein